MKTYALCPISNATVNEHAARAGALLTVTAIAIFLLTQSVWPILLLAIDFLLRAIPRPRYSPIAIASGWVVRRLPLQPHPINAGPKIFAARIGFLMASLSLVAFAVVPGPLAYLVASALGLFALLEGAAGLCVACKIYPLVYRHLYNGSFAS